MILPILKLGHPTLKKKALKVTDFNESLAQLANNMLETMIFHDGIGLASNQVGVLKRIFVMSIAKNDTNQDGANFFSQQSENKVFVNPKIRFITKEVDINNEGCLSIPNIRFEVERINKIEIRYQTVNGTNKNETLSGINAICAQHEMDHLDGILFLQRITNTNPKVIQDTLLKSGYSQKVVDSIYEKA